MKVLLMTIQNAPPGLDYDRDKKFSKSFKEMVAMCLVKDQTKRPTAEKLLKHSFFKYAKPPELSVKKLFTDLPPLWNRVKALQLKDAAQLALKKMPSAEQEAISQSEYQRGVSAWNFDMEDLKAQASLVQEDEETLDIREEEESVKPVFNVKDGSNLGKPMTSDVIYSEQASGNKGKTLQIDAIESDYQAKAGSDKNGPTTELPQPASEKDSVQIKIKTPAGKSRQTQSGPIMPATVLSHSMSEVGHMLERCENENQPLAERAQRVLRRAPSSSGPLMLPNRASANSLSAPIKSSGGFRDALEDKSKANLVQIKGRFSVTSENVDLVKDIPLCSVPRQFAQGSSLKKSASVGDWISDYRQMPLGLSPKETGSISIAPNIMPQLQNLFQQTSLQQDLIVNLLNSLQPAELSEAGQNGKLPPLHRSSENNGSAETPYSERECSLMSKISELQARMINLTEELNMEKLKYKQMQQRLNNFTGREEDRDRREDFA